MKFTLPSGDTEVIPLSNGGPLTTLCDTVAFPKIEFYKIYGPGRPVRGGANVGGRKHTLTVSRI